jgi:large subunit ribosomal protein L23
MTVLMHPVATEKAVSLVERHNTITYVVDYRAGKKEIADEFEKTFGVKVVRVNSHNTPTNTKIALIKLAKEYKASDVAEKLKLVSYG